MSDRRALTHRERILLGVGTMIVLGSVGATVALWAAPGDRPFAIKVIGGLFFAALLFYQIVIRQQREQEAIRETVERLRAAEEDYRENPRPRAAWEVARIKLENYVDQNLMNLRRIYILTSSVMIGGWILIAAGVWIAYKDHSAWAPATVAASAGALSQFVGSTFLFVYRSTMMQAGQFVSVLERINAVGMSVQILETIGDKDRELTDKARAEIARELLSMYTAKAKQE